MQTSAELETRANIYRFLNLWGGPTLALSDWYPWCCEGGNINTTAQKSSLCSHLDRCSQSWGSHQQPRSRKVMQTASVQLLSVKWWKVIVNGVCHGAAALVGMLSKWVIKSWREGQRESMSETDVDKEGECRDLDGCAGLKVLPK